MTGKPLKIAIAGAGVMGLTVARALRGHTATVFDPAGFPALNASAMAGGMLAPWAEIEHLPPAYIEAARAGLNFWRDLPGDAGFHQNGSLILAHEPDAHMLERFARKLPFAPERVRAADIEPDLEKFGAAIFLKDEAHLQPARALAALAEGKRIVETALDIDKAATEFHFVIDCRGIAAEDPNLRAVKGETLVLRNPEFALRRPVRLMHPRYPLYIVPRPGHEFMIGATLIESAGAHVGVKSAMELLSAAYSLHPSFGEAEILDIRAGLRPAYPDNLPRITVEGNVISCNGLFRHGYLLAPVMAQAVADFIAGRNNNFLNLFLRDHADNDQRPVKNNKRA